MASKRDLVLKTKKRSSTPMVIVGGLLLLGVIAIFSSISPTPGTAPVPYATQLDPQNYQGGKINQTPIETTVVDGFVQIPLQQVQDNKFIITAYTQGTKSVKLTSYVAPSGKVVTAISICEPCRSESFHIDDSVLVCNACGTRWELETLRGLSGGCQNFPPDALESTLVDGYISISESLVANWQPRI